MIRLRFSDLRGAHPDWIIRNGAHVISWWTRSPWNHVDAITPDGLFGAMPGDGVALRPTVPARAELIVEINCTPEQMGAFWWALRAHKGKGYDYLAVIGWASGTQDPHAWFCSEIIAAGLIAAGLMPGTKHVSPADLYACFAG